jgi:nitroreductase
MCTNDVLDTILQRSSVRRFTGEPVTRETLDTLVEAARWAPSGLNNQPWRFVTVEERAALDGLAALTGSGSILRGCGGAVAVFLDLDRLYHREKDIQGVGAAVENMLLAAHGLGLGACWLGEILNRRREAEALLGVPESLELMAVVAVGFPRPGGRTAARKRLALKTLIVGRR